METIKVISASDSRYVQHLGVTFTSLLENTPRKADIALYVIDGGLSCRDKEQLASCVSKYGCSLQFLTIDSGLYEKFGQSPSASAATYFRIFVPELLEPSVEKVIYIDCDIVVKADIAELWKVDVSDWFLAAVEDCGIEDCGIYGVDLKKRLGMTRRDRYFNAGVLVMNLAKWREYGISAKIRDFLLSNTDNLDFADQDGLNAILRNGWLPLPLAWNQQVTHCELFKKNKITREDMLESARNPRIIHYTTSYNIKTKPWSYMDMHPFKREYYRYLRLTPWKNFAPAGRTLGNRVYKQFSRTFAGKLLNRYVDFVKPVYDYDASHMPKSWARSPLVKLVYHVLFLFGYIYMETMTDIMEVSFVLEKEKEDSGVSRRGIWKKIAYGVTYPSRYMVPEHARADARKAVWNAGSTCPCCGNKGLKGSGPETGGVCKICFWQYDPAQSENPEDENGANEVPLSQARKNFLAFGASEMRYRYVVRKPYLYEK